MPRSSKPKPPYRIRHGLIVWMDGCPPLDGDEAKRRPLIVVLPDVPTGQPGDKVAIVVACSATYGADEPDGVELPNQSTQPQTTTGLPRLCWAIPRWRFAITHDRLNACEYSGTLGGATLRSVIAAYLREAGPANT